jgi:tRNA-specific 2-thiouridylase
LASSAGPRFGDDVWFSARIRSTGEPAPAIIRGSADGGTEVVFDSPQADLAPGQARVFYDGERMLGGGWIRRQTTADLLRPCRRRTASWSCPSL